MIANQCKAKGCLRGVAVPNIADGVTPFGIISECDRLTALSLAEEKG